MMGWFNRHAANPEDVPQWKLTDPAPREPDPVELGAMGEQVRQHIQNHPQHHLEVDRQHVFEAALNWHHVHTLAEDPADTDLADDRLHEAVHAYLRTVDTMIGRARDEP